MPHTYDEIRELALELPEADRVTLAHSLYASVQLESEEAASEPGYDAWFRANVEEALADDSPGIPHGEVMQELASIIQAARDRHKLQASA